MHAPADDPFAMSPLPLPSTLPAASTLARRRLLPPTRTAGLLAAWICAALAGCDLPRDAAELPGYIEADLAAVAAPVSGAVMELKVKEGDEIKVGQTLYLLESERERAQLEEAAAREEQARAQSANLGKGAREAELDQLRARERQAQAQLAQAQLQLRKTEALVKGNFVSELQLETDRTQVAVARAQLEDTRAALAAARMGARTDEQAAAEAQTLAAQAGVKQIEWLLQQKQVEAPVNGIVQEIYLRTGEYAQAGAAVLSVLQTGSLRVRFFVPNDLRPRFMPGAPLQIVISGCEQPLAARVARISARPEYTQPLMFGPELRDRMSFLTEARIEKAGQGACSAPPGTPVGVRVPAAPATAGSAASAAAPG